MQSTFLSWLIPFVCGGTIGTLGVVLTKIRAQRDGLQCLLRAEIIRAYDKYTARGYCPIYAKEALSKAYNAYHALGGNDVATNLFNEIIALPTEKENTQ